jgi:Tfp pilus assembly protein PilF
MSARGDRAGTRAALEQATLLAPNYVPAHLQLAAVFEASGQQFAAIERYRRVISLEPKNVVALNNLAYVLAVHRGTPKEALPIARQALELAPRSPMVIDTMAWVEYLAGDVASAAKRIPEVVRALPSNAEVRMHAATIYAAAGARAVAEVELQEALKLQPELEKSADVRKVRELLAAAAKR